VSRADRGRTAGSDLGCVLLAQEASLHVRSTGSAVTELVEQRAVRLVERQATRRPAGLGGCKVGRGPLQRRMFTEATVLSRSPVPSGRHAEHAPRRGSARTRC